MATPDFLYREITLKNSFIILLIGLTIIVILFLTRKKTGSSENYYFKAKKLRRKQIEQYVSSLEKKILELDRTISRLKVRENDLEIKFSVHRNESLHKELQKLRKQLTELANKRDRLLEEKQAYTRAYREVTL